MITSLESLAKKSGVSIQNIRTALKRFEKLEFLTNESTKTGRLLTVLNWELYQSELETPNKVANKDLTKTQQRPNKDLTTNKNDKNENNDKKNIEYMEKTAKRFSPPTIDEVKNYITEKGYSIDAEHFVAYYESNGWKVGKNKMKNWRFAVVTWAKNEKQYKNNYKPVERQSYRHPALTIFSDEVTQDQFERFDRAQKAAILRAQKSKDDT